MNIRSICVIGFCSLGSLRAQPATDATEYANHIQPFLAEYCIDCHGEKKQKGKFVLHDIDGVISSGKDIVRWEKILEMISLGDMPPEDEAQPRRIDRTRVTTWMNRELRKIGRGHDPGKLALPHQANRINHEDLFSGEHRGPAFTPARRWRKGPHIYSRFANEMRTKVSQPLLGLGGKGIQDYASLYADESTIKTMLRNSNLIAEDLLAPKRSHVNRHLNVLFKEGAAPTEEQIEEALGHLFVLIFQRPPSETDRERYIDDLFKQNRDLGGLKRGFHTLIMGMLMSQEFVFRMELGLGEQLPDGRRMLNGQELAYALSFAFFDQADAALVKAAAEARLTSREDVVREVQGILDRPDEKKPYWNYPMYHQWEQNYYQHAPRILRFFREFFGYDAVVDVFKDAERNPDHHALRLRKDADLFVLSVLERDQDVLKELLTSHRYPLDYLREDKMAKLLEGKNKKQLEHYQNKYGEEFNAIAASGKWPGLDSRHVSAYNLDRKQADAIRRDPGDLVHLPQDQRAGMLTHPAWLIAHSGNFDNDPIRRGKWIREHLLADLIPDVPIGVDARIPEDPQRTLRERLDVVHPPECWRCHKKMNPLGYAFEVYDDFGRYRERILIGDADGYRKAKRRYDGQKERWEKDLADWMTLDATGRARKVKEAEDRLTKLKRPDPDDPHFSAAQRRYEGDLKRWQGEHTKWTEMTDADQQKHIEGLRNNLAKQVEPIAEAKPVNAQGILDGTGDQRLDGPVEDAVELAHRLAQSERVRQSFVRHAFRYWMGRNETLDDAPTLRAADKAYVESGGSFKALLVSLLSSDSFLYRK